MDMSLNTNNTMPNLDLHALQTSHETPIQRFEKDPNVFVSPVSILPPAAGTTMIHDELPHLLLTSSRPGAAMEHVRGALQFVQTREPAAWCLLDSLAGRGHCGPIDRLKRAMQAGRHSGGGQAKEAYRTIERALGKWVVHEHRFRESVYNPAENEQEVLQSWGNRGGLDGLYREFKRNIESFARQEKTKYKNELDARKDALEGVLSPDHAKLVNNQKSAHLSKFMGVVQDKAKDKVILWLIETKYGASYTFFDQIPM